MKFEKPVVVINKVELKDVLTTSGNAANPQDDPYYMVGAQIVAYGDECNWD